MGWFSCWGLGHSTSGTRGVGFLDRQDRGLWFSASAVAGAPQGVKEVANHQKVAEENAPFNEGSLTHQLENLDGQIRAAGNDGEPFRPQPLAPQSIGFHKSNSGIEKRRASQKNEVSVVEVGSGLDENARVMMGRIEMELQYDRLGRFLSVVMDQSEEAEPDQHDQQSLASFKERHGAQADQ